jgi:hypothetical protein
VHYVFSGRYRILLEATHRGQGIRNLPRRHRETRGKRHTIEERPQMVITIDCLALRPRSGAVVRGTGLPIRNLTAPISLVANSCFDGMRRKPKSAWSQA